MVKRSGHPLATKASHKNFYSKVVRKYAWKQQSAHPRRYLYRGVVGDYVYPCHAKNPKLFKIVEYVTQQMPVGPIAKFRLQEVEWTRNEAGGLLGPSDKVVPNRDNYHTIGITQIGYALWKE